MSTFKRSLIIFHVVFLLILLTNIRGGYFLGWDGLYPELNFWLNLKRAFFAFWQENYGLGLLGGHGFAATLPHTLITMFLSIVMPDSAIRTAFTFLCLYTGGLGMYVLIYSLLQRIDEKGKHHAPAALFAALFYMCNLGTIQMFYIQLETFIGHFAALPWLFWSVLHVLHKPTKRNLFIFLLINFFATLQGFIPSLFVTYIAALSIVLFTYLIVVRKNFRRVALILLLTFTTNAYWLFPLLYYQITRSADFLSAYNNLISTPHFIEVNKKYGDLTNVALLKGFLFDSYQLGDYVLAPWIQHQKNIFVSGLGYAFFGLSIFGCIFMLLKKKSWQSIALTSVFVFSIIVMTTNTPPFSYITMFLQYISPTFEQAFRTTFTKFGLLASFSFSIFFAFGALGLFHYATRFLKRITPVFFVSTTLGAALLLYAFPLFQGHLLYNKLILPFPRAYTDVMRYFNEQGHGRIADFPLDCPEGWYAYNWGYFGSGFYWYGVEQPFLARSFDVWSRQNENYYWEVSQAMREQDYQKVDGILQKYDATWVLYDPNLLHCRNQSGFLTHVDWIKYLDASPNYSLAETFSDDVAAPIRIYKRNIDQSDMYVSLIENPPVVGPQYTSTDNDAAYQEFGTYITDINQNPAAYYPFRSLFTKRGDRIQDPTIRIENNQIHLQTVLPAQYQKDVLRNDAYSNLEKTVPVTIRIQRTTPATYAVTADLLLPNIASESPHLTLGSFTRKPNDPFVLSINDKVILQSNRDVTHTTDFSTALANTVTIADVKQNALLTWVANTDNTYQDIMGQELQIPLSQKPGMLDIRIPIPESAFKESTARFNVDKAVPIPCNEVRPSKRNKYEIGISGDQKYTRLISQNSSQCLTFNINDIPTSTGYLIEIKTRKVDGNNLRFSVSNKKRVIYNETYLDGKNDFASTYIVLPPTFPNEVGYDITFTNISESNQPTINDIQSIRMFPLPYTYLSSLHLSAQQPLEPGQLSPVTLNVQHPNETRYNVSYSGVESGKTTYLALYQAYDPGWKAYVVDGNKPFLFGKQLPEHVMINNWANGWRVAGDTNVVIVYLPQYIQYLGFILLLVPFFVLPFLRDKHTR